MKIHRFRLGRIVAVAAGVLVAPAVWPQLVDDDLDGVENSLDVCPNTVVPEAIPSTGSLGPQRYALSALPIFEDNDVHIPLPDHTISDTAGCSCEQILVIAGQGPTASQVRRGCTVETMLDWIALNSNVAPGITSNGGGASANINVPENTTAVTDVDSTDDRDAEGAGLTYSLTTVANGGADNSFFTLNTATGVLTFTNAPDFETIADDNGDNNYEVQVTVTDSGPGTPLTDVQDVTVSVTDVTEVVNQAPTDIQLSNSAVAEGAANGTVVGSLSTLDPDAIDSHSYTLDDDAGGRFVLGGAAGDEVLVLNGSLLDAAVATSHDITVTSTDSGNLPFTRVLSIVVIPNNAPTDIQLSNSAVTEGAASGTVVGSLSTTDPDAGDSHSYTLDDDAGGLFRLDGIAGDEIQVVDGDLLDADTVPSHDITVTSTDSGGLPLTRDFSIAVTDVNETPTDIQLSNSAVTEGAANGTVVGTLSTLDPDAGDSHSYTLDLNAGGRFTLGGAAGDEIQVLDGTLLDAETATSLDITVTSTDSGGLPLTRDFSIAVTDVNETPTDIQLSNSAVTEGAAIGTVVGTLSTLDPDAGDSHTYDLDINAWFTLGGTAGDEIQVGALLDADATPSLDITVTSTDSGNLPFTRDFSIVVNANDSPGILITSHSQGEAVPVTGFILSGNVTDDIGVDSLTASLDDPLLGRTVDQKPVDFASASGRWSLVVFDGQISLDQTISVTLTAIDVDGRSNTLPIDLQVTAADRSGRHAIDRITFGATPSLLQDIKTLGAAGYIAQQLDPATIDDSAFDSQIEGLNPTTLSDLQVYQFLHAANSLRQLREVLTLFWDNHFNTNIHTHGNVQYELDENNQFRAKALGKFRDLLEISAKSPAMLFYLDGVSNVKVAPNENYARELMELHTLGVDGGYSQDDVEEVARAFTGWSVQNGFFFNASQHDTDPKTVLGQSIDAGGVGDGEQVLDIVAGHPSTASFICEKLIILLVADDPPASLVSGCATVFQNAGDVDAPDQIAQVVGFILASPEFNDSSHYLGKLKTPFEIAVGAVRQLEAPAGLGFVAGKLENMGMLLFENDIPTGYSETGDDWISSNLILERMKFVNEIAFTNIPFIGHIVDPLAFFPLHGYETAEGIVGYLFELAISEPASQLEWSTALGVLTDEGTTVFDIEAADAELKLRRLIGTVLSYPGFSYQ